MTNYCLSWILCFRTPPCPTSKASISTILKALGLVIERQGNNYDDIIIKISHIIKAFKKSL
jgi:hypothetical protein